MEIGPHVYRVEKAPNPAAPAKTLHFAPLPDLVDFCTLTCLLLYYHEHGEQERGLEL